MNTYTITDEDFNRCIGSWLNADNANYQEYVKGIKLFNEYLNELMENAQQVTKEVKRCNNPYHFDLGKLDGYGQDELKIALDEILEALINKRGVTA